MSKLLPLLLLTVIGCTIQAPERRAKTETPALYDGKIYGIYQPLKLEQDEASIKISGETFSYTIDRKSGQITSAKALGSEFVAQGTSFPNPYVGLMPESDPGARVEGEDDRPRFSFEKALEIRPRLWSGGLTGAYRFDADKSTGVVTQVVSSAEDFVEIKSSGGYAWPDSGKASPLAWEIKYAIDVDGFTKITVKLTADKPVKLRWHCFDHAWFDRQAVDFLSTYQDLGSPPFDPRPAVAKPLDGLQTDEPALLSHWDPIVHLGNALTGIDISKEDFGDRWSGYRDSGVRLEDGRRFATDAVETADGQVLIPYDSRGKRDIFTQIFAREGGVLELEEFDIRNTALPLNPGEAREKTFFVQLTPPKLPREELNSSRVVWPGPHQIVMAHFNGRREPWSPPAEDQIAQWAKIGVNLIVGGTDCFSGDYSHPAYPEKVRQFLDTAHRYGIQVIPYVTFSDYDFDAPGYQEHAADWMCSQAIEFRQETSLMCFGAEGWREHVERECDSLLTKFDFDGLYVDHWFTTRFCNNPRHGCGGYLGRYVTEGYHDFARRLRRVVAAHTDGKGIMLLNSNALISSTNLAWFDMRLLGENDNPLLLPGEELLATWNGKRTGVQSSIMWRENQDTLDMLNFSANFAFSFTLRGSRGSRNLLDEWIAAEPGSELGFNRLYWEILRFFDVNRARRFSTFDSRIIVSLARPGSQATAFAREGRLLLFLGYLAQQTENPAKGARPGRPDTLSVSQPEALGLDSGTRYRIVDLVNSRYFSSRSWTAEELKSVPLTLILGRTSILLLTPEEEGPQLVYFRGADSANILQEGQDSLALQVKAVEGSPVSFYFDLHGGALSSGTAGIAPEKPSGDFTVFSGLLPADKRVVFAKEH